MLRAAIAVLVGLASFTALRAQAPAVEFPATSPAATLRQRVGLTDIEIVYSRPSARGRRIFGELVPFGQVWRTGANNATKVTFSTPVKLNGTAIPAGTYGLFTIPGAANWTIILSKAPDQWGAYKYSDKDDVARISAAPVALKTPVESFTIDFSDLRAGAATLNLSWELTRVPVAVEVDVVGQVVAKLDAAMAGPGKKPYVQGAQFYLEYGLDPAKANAWIDAALAENPKSYTTVYWKARVLARMGDKAGAAAAARRSIELAAGDGVANAEYRRLDEELIASLGL